MTLNVIRDTNIGSVITIRCIGGNIHLFNLDSENLICDQIRVGKYWNECIDLKLPYRTFFNSNGGIKKRYNDSKVSSNPILLGKLNEIVKIDKHFRGLVGDLKHLCKP